MSIATSARLFKVHKRASKSRIRANLYKPEELKLLKFSLKRDEAQYQIDRLWRWAKYDPETKAVIQDSMPWNVFYALEKKRDSASRSMDRLLEKHPWLSEDSVRSIHFQTQNAGYGGSF